MIRPITLASSSPRRLALLDQIGVSAKVAPVDVVEEEVDPAAIAAEGIPSGELAREVCLRRSRLKMGAAAALPGTELILCADTVVARNGELFDKPVDSVDAERMLRALSNGTHQVYTAVILSDHGKTHSMEEIITTHVTFDSLSPDAIDWYLDSEEWNGVAGGYRIQGRAGAFVSWLQGSYTAVMGLPIHTVYSMINRFRPRVP